jgi:hypothetical protein
VKVRSNITSMKNRVYDLFFGAALVLASAGVSHGMSELVSITMAPAWPTNTAPGNVLIYNITSAGRTGSGLLEVKLDSAALPPGIKGTFSPSVLRFTGNDVTSQSALLTITCPTPMQLDKYPFTVTGTTRRESVTFTNQATVASAAAASGWSLLTLEAVAGGGLNMRGTGNPAQTYRIEYASDVPHPVWTTLGTTVADGNGRLSYFASADRSSSARFFRAVALASPQTSLAFESSVKGAAAIPSAGK